MLRTNRTRVFAALLIAATLGCQDSMPTAPSSRAADGLNATKAVSSSSKVYVLRRRTPLDSDLTVSATIGYAGGALTIPAAGLSVTIPQGALLFNTKISVTALHGKYVAYEFGPHGQIFLKRITVEQSLSDTYSVNNAPDYRAAYFNTDPSSWQDLLVSVLELLTTTVDVNTNVARFGVIHFSGYLMSSGLGDSGGFLGF
jgi:hypothetical protein